MRLRVALQYLAMDLESPHVSVSSTKCHVSDLWAVAKSMATK